MPDYFNVNGGLYGGTSPTTPLSPTAPTAMRPMADTMSSGAQRATGLAATMGLLPFMLQQSLQNQQVQMLTSAAANPVASGSGAAGSKGSKDSGVGAATRSPTKPNDSGSLFPPDFPKEGGGRSDSNGNQSMIDRLLSKMFGEDEDDDLQHLRKSLTRERLKMELRKEKMAHREEMAKMQAEKRARQIARQEADRVRGQAHRERSKRDGAGVAIDPNARARMAGGMVDHNSPPAPGRSKAERKAEYEKGASGAKKKKHMKNLGVTDEGEFDRINTNVGADEYMENLMARQAEERAEAARAKGQAAWQAGL
jgi:hypothetical protein